MPELLCPAGDYESLLYALDYGADAVYLAGKSFGMRAGAKNFSAEELCEAVGLAHEKGVKVYVTCNIIPSNEEIERFPELLSAISEAGADAVIAADVGVISMIRELKPKMEIHASTQTGVANYRTASELYKMGVKRAVLARELSLEEIKVIRKNIPGDMELEAFVHGAMCVSFSGRCLISEYLTGRNANRGACAQPCRWEYYLMEQKRPGEFYKVFEDARGSFILNARDMCLIEHLGELADAGINSFKIEGRAKSAYYTALTANAYRAALDSLKKGEKVPEWAIKEVDKISHRPYCTGFFFGKPSDGSGSQDGEKLTNGGQYFADSNYIRKYDFAAAVEGCKNGEMEVLVRNYFGKNDTLELMIPGKEPEILKIERIIENGEEVEAARRPMSKVIIKTDAEAPARALIRRKLEEKP